MNKRRSFKKVKLTRYNYPPPVGQPIQDVKIKICKSVLAVKRNTGYEITIIKKEDGKRLSLMLSTKASVKKSINLKTIRYVNASKKNSRRP